MPKSGKTYTEEPISCQHCGNIAPMRQLGEVSDMIEEVEAENHPAIAHGDIFQILKCPACKETTIRKYYWHDGYMEPGEYLPQFVNLYPAEKKAPQGMPSHIQSSYIAAEKVRNIDANAYGVLIRRLLELVCIDRKAVGRTLNDQLNDLASKGEIPTNLTEISHKLRILGNIGAHAGSGELNQGDLPILNTLSNAILEYVYSAPHYAQLARNAVSARKRQT